MLVELVEILLEHQFPNLVITEANAVVEVTKPNDGVVIFNCSVPLKPKTLMYCFEVSIPIVIIRKARCKMRCDETYSGVGEIKANGACALVATNSRQARLRGISVRALRLYSWED